ncbi:hypothetical protein V8G54_026817 [Vigna mungo]|uniref:Uncharacterized protein n=1 Tax=Vigna mungo TaxID=3915 RepID=A0AAQ3N191_VIGMU
MTLDTMSNGIPNTIAQSSSHPRPLLDFSFASPPPSVYLLLRTELSFVIVVVILICELDGLPFWDNGTKVNVLTALIESTLLLERVESMLSLEEGLKEWLFEMQSNRNQDVVAVFGSTIHTAVEVDVRSKYDTPKVQFQVRLVLGEIRCAALYNRCLGNSNKLLSVELVKCCYGDRGNSRFILGASKEVFGRGSSFVKYSEEIQRRCRFISCGINRGGF